MKRPAVFIPSLYFIEGLPYTLVVLVSVVFYKNLGESNDFIGRMTSLLYLPWVLKFAWAPLVDMFGAKRLWIVVAQVVLAICAFMLAVSLSLPSSAFISLCAFALMALASATQDVAIDGYYLEALTVEQQSFFVGVRNAAYKVAWLFGQGGLVYLAGALGAVSSIGVRGGWTISFSICSVIFLLASLFHFFILPKASAASVAQSIESRNFKTFLLVFKTFFTQKKIVPIVIYILIFRLGDALMLKMAQPFLLDDLAKGGLALKTEQVGIIYGGVGVGSLLLGGIVGGFVVSKFGLKRCLMPTAIIQNSAILLYYILSTSKPNLYLVATFNAIEQFSYGLGTAAYTVFLLKTVSPAYRSGHYAIATALMAFGVMVPGYFSGQLTEILGYQNFFLLSFLMAIPGMICILLLPLESDVSSTSADGN